MTSESEGDSENGAVGGERSAVASEERSGEQGSCLALAAAPRHMQMLFKPMLQY